MAGFEYEVETINEAIKERELHRLQLEKNLPMKTQARNKMRDDLKKKLWALHEEVMHEDANVAKHIHSLMARVETLKREYNYLAAHTEHLRLKKRKCELELAFKSWGDDDKEAQIKELKFINASTQTIQGSSPIEVLPESLKVQPSRISLTEVSHKVPQVITLPYFPSAPSSYTCLPNSVMQGPLLYSGSDLLSKFPHLGIPQQVNSVDNFTQENIAPMQHFLSYDSVHANSSQQDTAVFSNYLQRKESAHCISALHDSSNISIISGQHTREERQVPFTSVTVDTRVLPNVAFNTNCTNRQIFGVLPDTAVTLQSFDSPTDITEKLLGKEVPSQDIFKTKEVSLQSSFVISKPVDETEVMFARNAMIQLPERDAFPTTGIVDLPADKVLSVNQNGLSAGNAGQQMNENNSKKIAVVKSESNNDLTELSNESMDKKHVINGGQLEVSVLCSEEKHETSSYNVHPNVTVNETLKTSVNNRHEVDAPNSDLLKLKLSVDVENKDDAASGFTVSYPENTSTVLKSETMTTTKDIHKNTSSGNIQSLPVLPEAQKSSTESDQEFFDRDVSVTATAAYQKLIGKDYQHLTCSAISDNDHETLESHMGALTMNSSDMVKRKLSPSIPTSAGTDTESVDSVEAAIEAALDQRRELPSGDNLVLPKSAVPSPTNAVSESQHPLPEDIQATEVKEQAASQKYSVIKLDSDSESYAISGGAEESENDDVDFY